MGSSRVAHGRLALLALGLSSCGAGVAGVAATSGGSSGGSTPTITSFRVLGPKVSPATLHFEASEGVLADLFFVRGGIENPMTALTDPGVSGNRVQLPAGVTELTWDFSAELGSTTFVPDVDLVARRTNGTPISGGTLHLGMGNDAPAIEGVFAPNAEVVGTADVRFTVSDSSADLVDVRVEINAEAPLFPESSWAPAHPAGLPPGTPTPEFAFRGVRARTVAEGGTPLAFFWDVVGNLGRTERDVRMRFTPVDLDENAVPVEVGIPIASATFHVDNNAAPVVQLQNDVVIGNPDEVRGIPLPFRVIDEEGDVIEVIFQWRRAGEAFPPLPSGDSELDAILSDPTQRREHHVCTAYPHFARGMVIPVDATTVRLPELASSESWILASGLEGKTIELLRHSTSLGPITSTWKSNTLASPVAVQPIGDGLTALVLDAPGGAGRLQEIALATGEVLREVARIAGIPTAMALERGGAAMLLASESQGVWRLERIELASGAVGELFTSDGSHEPPPVRGVASLGSSALLLTAGSSLLRLGYRDLEDPRLGVIRDDLATPWGVVLDPLSTNQVYVAERDAARTDGIGRVLILELDAHWKEPVIVNTSEMVASGLDRPTALALARNGSRLLAVTNGATDSRLVGLDLGAPDGNVLFPLGAPSTNEIASVASGEQGLILTTIPGANELFASGGIEQRRPIVASEAMETLQTGQFVSVGEAFDPAPRLGQRWRIQPEPRLRASPEEVERIFTWDGRADLPSAGGSVFLRAVARDDELGLGSEGRAPKRLRAELDTAPVVLGGFPLTDGPTSIALTDIDGDGDQDLASANRMGNDLTVFFQDSPGCFSEAPLVLGGAGVMDGPGSLVVADLDGDGDQDLASANLFGFDLTLFFQESSRRFTQSPLVVGGVGVMQNPRSLATSDLDGDGDLDLVSANTDFSFFNSGHLTVFFQESSGSFSASPRVVGETIRPRSVVASDLDGDGDVDLASANEISSLTVFFQDSPGRFAASPLTITGSLQSPTSLLAADLDGNGDMDLASGSDRFLTVFFQQGLGRFTGSPLVLAGFPFTLQPRALVAADLDGDDRLDLASANELSSALTVFFQDSPGSFADSPLVLGGVGITDAPFSLAAADLDGDGDQDLASANKLGDDLTLFFRDSPGSFVEEPTVIGGFGAFSSPRSLVAADLDGDGDLDLASANSGFSEGLKAFFQESPRSFFPVSIGTGPAFSVAAADLNGDGGTDLVTANGGGMTVFIQQAPGSFLPPLFLAQSTPVAVVAADLDGDGDVDLASAGFFGLAMFTQSPTGDFTRAPLVLGGAGITEGPVSLAAADLDGDGDIDLASANRSGSDLTIFFQESPGSFGIEPSRLGGAGITDGPASVAAGDLDDDGDIDLVSANQSGADLSVYLQSAPGSFAAPPARLGGASTSQGPSGLSVADLDGDGDLELVSANTDGNDLTVFYQVHPGVFARAPLVLGGFLTTARPGSLISVDIDGDGDMDIASGNFGEASGVGGNNLTIFWGGR